MAKWIWYPGDYEIHLGNRVMERREQQGEMSASMWRIDLPTPSLSYKYPYKNDEDAYIRVRALGRVSVRAGGDRYSFPEGDRYLLPKGEYELRITVYNPGGLPALYTDGAVETGEGWKVCTGAFGHPDLLADFGEFDSPDAPPVTCNFAYQVETPVKAEKTDEGMLYDFGRETFGYLRIEGAKKRGEVMVYYGESREEAMDKAEAECRDLISYEKGESVHHKSRAMRYVHVLWGKKEKGNVSLLAENLPLTYRGEFSSSDEEMNRIYEVSYRTLHLCARETFLDGIKRDRWYWSGDATQSYLLNFYSFFDQKINERTMWAIRGKDPMDAHLNLILDYSFYWLISLYDHYLYTGDTDFLRKIYPRAKTLLEFCETKKNENGFAVGTGSDWVFLDWADMDMSGEVCAEQILFHQSYLSMAAVSEALFGTDYGYLKKAKELKEKIMEAFWDEARGVFIHSRKDGKPTEKLTRYAGVFSLLYDFLDEEKKRCVIENMILSDEIMPITTPYMQFYELAGLCLAGEVDKVTDRVRAYWGGMLSLGATSFWEEYNPEAESHLSMYGRPFAKSLCHAWGAGPIYLFGRFYLGVMPTEAGYKKFTVMPGLGGLSEIHGSVPTPTGDIRVDMDESGVKVYSTSEGEGTLIYDGKTYPISKGILLEINK